MQGSEQLSEDLLSIEQAAAKLGRSVRFMRRLVNERRIRFYHVGKYVMFDPADLRAFIRAGVVEPITVRRHYRNGMVAYG